MSNNDFTHAVRLLIRYGADRRSAKQLDQYTRTIDPARVTSWHYAQPDIPARVATLLALHGVDPASPQADQFAAQSRRAAADWYRTARTMLTATHDTFHQSGELNTSQRSDLADAMRSGDVDQLRASLFNIQKGDGPGLVGHLAGAAISGLEKIAPRGALATITGGISELPKLGGQIRQAAGENAKPAVRIAALAANTPLQLGQAAIRDFAHDIYQKPLTLGVGATNAAPEKTGLAKIGQNISELGAQTQGGQALSAYIAGRPVDIGSGILPDPQSATGQAAAQAARDYSPYLIGGHAFTVGRAAASAVFEPNTTPFNLLSGAVDAGIALKFDPVNNVMAYTSAQRGLNNVFAGMGDPLTEEQAAAGLRLTPKPGASGIGYENWAASSKGQQTAAYLARNKDFRTAFDMTRDVPTALATVDANTPEQVLDTIRSAVQNGYTHVPQVPGFGYTIGRALSDNIRAVADTPEAWTSASRPEHLVSQSINDMLNAKLPKAAVDTHAYNIARAVNQQAPYVGLVEAMSAAKQDIARNILLRGNVPDDVADEALRLTSAQRVTAHGVEETTRRLSTSEISRRLQDTGIEPDLADRYAYQADQAAKVTRIFHTQPGQMRSYMIDDLGNDINPWLEVNGTASAGPSPVRTIDFLSPDTRIPMGDWRSVKQMTGLLRGVYRFADYTKHAEPSVVEAIKNATEENWAAGAVETARQLGARTIENLDAAHSFLNYAMAKVWKPVMLMRLGWVARVVGESQTAMGVNDLDSLISGHPLRAIGWITGRDSTPAGANLAEEALGNPLDPYTLTLQRFGGSRIPPDQTSLFQFTRAFEPSEGDIFYRKWAARLARTGSNELDKSIANSDVASTLERYWPQDSGPGPLVTKMMGDERVARTWTDRQKFGDYLQLLADDQARLTRGNPALQEVLATGKWGRRALADETAGPGATFGEGETAPREMFSPKGGLSPAFTKWLKGFDPPPRVIGEDASVVADRTNRWDMATSHILDMLMAGPDRHLSLSPAYRQIMWQEQLRTASLLQPGEQRKLLDVAAGNVGLDDLTHESNWLFDKVGKVVSPQALPTRLQNALRNEVASGSGDLTLTQTSQMAKAYALEHMQAVAHELPRRNQFFDTFRLLFPFGDAYKLIAQRWLTLMGTHPEAARRLQQLYQGAQQSGFFYQDPTTGDESFAYPGLGQLAKVTGAGPVNFVAKPQALSIAGSGLPGFGPIPQIASKHLIPDRPGWDQLRALIDPYGTPDDQNSGWFDQLINASTPAWGRYLNQVVHFVRTPAAARQYASTVASIMQYKESTGAYSDTPEDQRRLLADAKHSAQPFFFLRALNAFTLPAASTPEFRAADRDGHYHTINALQNELHGLEQGDPATAKKFHVDPADANYDTAPLIMIDAYGEQAVRYLLAGKTKPNVSGLPISTQGDAWMKSHSQLKAVAPDVYGYFAPDRGKFDPNVVGEQLARGERSALTPEQLVQISNDRLATARYNHQKTKLDAEVAVYKTGSSQHAAALKAEQAALRQITADLTEKYPGFRNPVGVTTRATVDQQISEIREAVAQPSLRGNQVAAAVRQYLKLRDTIEHEAADAGIVQWWTSSRVTRGVAALADLQTALKKKYPDSARVFDRLFARDVGA